MRSLLTALLAVVALVLAACSGDASSDSTVTGDAAADTTDPETGTETPDTTTTTTTTTQDPPPPFDYVERGEFGVGVATVRVNEGSERPLTVDVWFPLAEATAGELQQYTLLPGVFYESPTAIAAELTSIADGQFPLVVYSHGSGGQRWIHSDYTEFIASHGYVVVAPDHTGNTLVERFSGSEIDGQQVAFDRPTDVTEVLDAAINDDPDELLDDGLAGHLTDDVIVTGHSFGGFTSYATVSGVTTTAGEYLPDERVDAIITLAPAAGPELLTDELLTAVDVPHLVMVGDSDDVTPIDPNVERPWALVTGAPSYRVELVAAEHQSFTDLCAYQEALPLLDTVPELVIEAIDSFAATDCVPTAMNFERVREITNSFAVRFLDEVTQDATPLGDDEVVYPDDIRFLTK